MLEGAARVGCEVGEEGIDLAEIKPAGDILCGVGEDCGQISRQRVEHRAQVIGAVLKVGGVGTDRDLVVGGAPPRRRRIRRAPPERGLWMVSRLRL